MTSVPLTASLPWRFRDYTPPDALVELDGTGMAWIDDHGSDAALLLLDQFKEKPNLVATIRALCAGIQDLEDGAWQVLTERWLDTSLGVQLDALGTIVGLGRLGYTDETYRLLLRAQVLVLRSCGTWRDLLGILDVLEVDLATVETREPWPAAIVVELSEHLDGEIDGAGVFRLLNRAKPAGVRLSHVFPTAAAAATFTFAEGSAALEPDDALGFGDATGADVGGVLTAVLATTEKA